MLPLPRTGTESRRYVYARTSEQCLLKYKDALGIGAIRVRPGSISEFLAVKFAPWQASQIQGESIDRYDSTWRIHLGPAVGHYLFSELTYGRIESIFAEFTPGVSASAKSLLTKIVRYAIAHGNATPELLTAVQLIKVAKRKTKHRRDVATRARAMLAKAKGHNIEGFLYTALTLGLRKGELCGLQVTDLDDAGITIRRQRDHKRGVKDRVKHREAGEVRRIGLPAVILTRIRSYIRPGSLFLFVDERGKPLAYNHIDRLIEPFQPKDAEDRLTPHDFRAAAIVNLIEAGVNDHTIQDLMGHGSAKMIRVYRDDSEERTRDALKRLTGDQ